MKPEVDRAYHHFRRWEDFKSGMYEKTCFMDEHKMQHDCELILTEPRWLWESMTFVSHCWRYSAEHHLTNTHRNRQAWLGQAACCWTHGAPEYITKRAWNALTKAQQDAANATADEVLADWEEKYRAGYFKRRMSA